MNMDNSFCAKFSSRYHLSDHHFGAHRVTSATGRYAVNTRTRRFGFGLELLEERKLLTSEFNAAVMANGSPFNQFLFDFTRDPIVRIDRTYGLSSHQVAVAGDWDGNGSSDIGVIVPENGFHRWLLDTDGDPEVEISFIYGLVSDFPVVGDWDGNGTWTPGIARPENGFYRWLFDNNFDSNIEAGNFIFGGQAFGDVPVAGNWDGIGGFNVGVARPENGFYRWLLDTNEDPSVEQGDFLFGGPVFGHTPITGDWDGDGTTNAGAVGPDPCNA